MRRLTIVCAGLLLVVAASSPALAQIKIAYVDVQRALNECNAGKKAKGEFRVQIERLEDRLSKQQIEVKALKEEIEKKGMLMKEDERRNLQEQYARKLRDFERTYKDSREELERKDNEITGAIVRDLARVIRTVGERDGYTVVLEKGGILWGAPSIDVTEQVIRAYNATNARIGSLGAQAEIKPASAGAPQPSDFGEDLAKKSTISK